MKTSAEDDLLDRGSSAVPQLPPIGKDPLLSNARRALIRASPSRTSTPLQESAKSSSALRRAGSPKQTALSETAKRPSTSPGSRTSSRSGARPRAQDENWAEHFGDLHRRSHDAFPKSEAREVLGLADNRVNAGKVKGLMDQNAALSGTGPFPPKHNLKPARSLSRNKQRQSTNSSCSKDAEALSWRDASLPVDDYSLRSLPVGDHSLRNLAQHIAEEMIVRGPSAALKTGGTTTRGSLPSGRPTPVSSVLTPVEPLSSSLSQAQEHAALQSTAKSVRTAGCLRRRLHEALQEAGLHSLMGSPSQGSSEVKERTAEGESTETYRTSSSRPSSAQAHRTRESSPVKNQEVARGSGSVAGLRSERSEWRALEEKLAASEAGRADLERELRAERERKEGEVAAIRKEAAEKMKKLQRHVRKAEEEKSALAERVLAASADRTSEQTPLTGASAAAPILVTERQNALLKTQSLAAKIVPRESVSRGALQDLEGQLERARTESRGLERENARLVRELDGLGARQSEQAEKLAVFQAQMREHMDKVLAAERSLEGFRQGSGEGGVEKLLERVKGLEAENAARQEQVEELLRKLLGGEGEKEALRERAAGLQSEIEALRAEIVRQGGGAERWGEMRRDLEAALSKARAVQDELKKERAEGGALRQEVSGLRAQVGVLEEGLKKERGGGVALRQEVSGLCTQVGVLEETLRAVENERDRGLKGAEERERVLRGADAKKQEQVVVLQRDLADAQEEIQTGERKLLASARKESQMRVELREARERHAELAARFEALQKVKGSLERQVKAAKAAESRAVSRVERQERHVAELTGRLVELEARAGEGALRKEAADEMRERFEGLRESMRAEIEARKARVLELEWECEQARAATEEANKRAEGLVISSREREERHVAEIGEVWGSERALRAEVSAALAERDRQKSEAEGLGVLVAEARSEIERLTAEGAEALVRLERLQESERTAREKLVVALGDAEEGRSREEGLRERLVEVEEKVQRSEEEARDRLLKKDIEIEELKRSQKELETALEEARVKVGKLQDWQVEARKLLEDRATALKNAEERVRLAEAGKRVLENRAVALTEQLRECELAKVGLEERLEELKIERSAKAAEAEGRVGALIERLGEAERELSECRERLRMAGEESVTLEEYCGTLGLQLAAKDGELERLVQVYERKREEDLAEGRRAEQARAHKDVAERVRGLESALAQANKELLEERGKMGESERLRYEIDKLVGSLQNEQRECENLRGKVAELEQEVLEKDGQLGIIRTQGDMDYYITPQKERHRGRF